MSRVTYRTHDGDTAWFEYDKARLVTEDATEWDGNNRIHLSTGSQWTSEDLYRTAGGAWVVLVDNRDGRHGRTVGESWHGLTAEDAEQWLRKQGLHEIADREFEPIEERGPGRPEIGGRAAVSYGDDLLHRIDAAADEAGLTRAEWLRRTAEAALTPAQAGTRLD